MLYPTVYIRRLKGRLNAARSIKRPNPPPVATYYNVDLIALVRPESWRAIDLFNVFGMASMDDNLFVHLGIGQHHVQE